MSQNKSKTLCIFLSITLYGLSLYLPAAITSDFRGLPVISHGYELLGIGWLGLINLQPAWFANPLYLFALLSYGYKLSYRLCMAALILALFSPLLLVHRLLIGFYLWVASIAVLLYGASAEEV